MNRGRENLQIKKIHWETYPKGGRKHEQGQKNKDRFKKKNGKGLVSRGNNLGRGEHQHGGGKEPLRGRKGDETYRARQGREKKSQAAGTRNRWTT